MLLIICVSDELDLTVQQESFHYRIQ